MHTTCAADKLASTPEPNRIFHNFETQAMHSQMPTVVAAKRDFPKFHASVPSTPFRAHANGSVYQPREQRSPRRPLGLSCFSRLSTNFYPPLLLYPLLM